MISVSIAAIPTVLILNSLEALEVAIPPIGTCGGTGIKSLGGKTTRLEYIGSGFGITFSSTTKGADVIYLASIETLWNY